MHITHYLPRALPEPLAGLTTLALDLRWSWHHGTDILWETVDPICGGNPQPLAGS